MRTILCAALVLVAAVPARAGVVNANDLRQIGLAYHQYFDDHNRGPAKADDLAPYVDNSKRLLGLLKKEEIIFFYKVSLTQMPAGTSNTVLAYEKDVPEKGGWVLMADGSTKKMKPEEFKKAAKAGKVKGK
jgi:hypothetical protein